ncbi:MAG: hypothetical protein CM15mP60_1320 [Alphaproteobacteria bacterium]|nr:MAG: hypothetical protein CM15mP60_1320 [Alphaproteobacteria bacterium]
MYQRVIIVTFKDELSKASMTSYLHPIIKAAGRGLWPDSHDLDPDYRT